MGAEELRLCPAQHDSTLALWRQGVTRGPQLHPSACPGEQPVPGQALGHSNSHNHWVSHQTQALFVQSPYEPSMRSPRFQMKTLRHEQVK